jgi:ribonuclease HI
MAVYVALDPTHIRGIYDTWPACEAKVKGVAGARYQKVATVSEAEALLAGQTPTMPDGTYAFIDGNHLGGVGVVLVHRANDQIVTKEIATSVSALFPTGLRMPGDPEAEPVSAATLLSTIRNVAAELAALYQALLVVKPRTTLTIVYDYAGIGHWMTGTWKARDTHVRALATLCEQTRQDRGLTLTFQWQPGHQPDATGQNLWVQFNRRADQLATQGTATV